MTNIRVINHLNHAHCVMHECYHAGPCTARHAPHFPNQIFIMEMTHMLPVMRLGSAGHWICRISTLSSNTVNVSSISLRNDIPAVDQM